MGPEISCSKLMTTNQPGSVKTDPGQEDSAVAGFTETLEGRSPLAHALSPFQSGYLGNYKNLRDNPLSWFIKEENKTIKDSNLDEVLKMSLLPRNEITPNIYGAPKIHKNGAPLRPIVNAIGSPMYSLAKYVANILASLVGKTNS